jgi:hypothetical protein
MVTSQSKRHDSYESALIVTPDIIIFSFVVLSFSRSRPDVYSASNVDRTIDIT